LALCHNLKDLPPTCSNTSHQHWTSVSAFSASNSCCHHGKTLKSDVMAVTSGLPGLNNT
jgi:hypothetical protein